MKKRFFLLLPAMALLLFGGCHGLLPETSSGTRAPTEPIPAPERVPTTETAAPEAVQYADIKAMWLSQFDMAGIYRDGDVQRDAADFTARMEQVLDNIKNQGFNTVFLQVRPYGDSMYPSAYYPMSAYVTGRCGGEAAYDPVEIILRLAHQRLLSVHAWINPFRAMTEQELQQLDGRYPIAQWYADPALRGRYIVSVNGRWYLNPAYEPVRELICAGAEEALSRYAFDGLHMDDYFYPTTEESFDAEAFSQVTDRALADFRRDNVSALVQSLWQLTHSFPEERLFGISPAGNVDTVYHSHYADVYRWCGTEGFIDYICPQVYFGLEHETHGFVKVCHTYRDMIRTGSVELLVGMTFGKAYTGEDPWAGTGKDEWKNNKDVLARCLQTTAELIKCRGISVFSYQYFFDPVTGEPVLQTAQEREQFTAILRDMTWGAGA